MNFKRIVISLGVFMLLLGCSTATNPNPASATQTPIIITSEVTNEPITTELALPRLSNAEDTWYWQLTAVDLVESYTDSLDTTYWASPDKLLLRVEFEAIGVPDENLWDMFNFDNYYVTDSMGNEYKAGNGQKTGTVVWNLFQVPKDSDGFVFHFFDWSPLELGK